MDKEKNLDRATQIVVAFIEHNAIIADDLPQLIDSVYNALQKAGQDASDLPYVSTQTTTQEPAVPIKDSVTDDYIVCLEDGKRLKVLKRYIRTNYGLSPEDYKRRWGLDSDYPLVAPNYSKVRSRFAKEKGLGKRLD